MCGDSTKREDVLKLMNGEKADMVFTDPPYILDYLHGKKRAGKPTEGFGYKRDRKYLETDDSKKENLLQQCIERPSLLEWLSSVGMTMDGIIPDTDDIDKKFIFLMKSMNGFGYHIGNVLWQRQLDGGANLSELVMKRSGEMRKRLEQY